MGLTWIMLPLVGGLIGWVTNVIAIRMLFWPRDPISIPFTRLKIIGLLPKRRQELAASIGHVVNENLLPIDEVLAHVENLDPHQQIVGTIIGYVDQRLDHLLPRILPGAVKVKIKDYLIEIIHQESEQIVEHVVAQSLDKLKESANLGALVQEKIESFDLSELEVLIKGISSAELRHIEILGAVLGFFIGVIQALIVYWGIYLQ